MTSEVYSYIYEKVLEEGALDIYTESIYMKKNRPATKLSVLCYEEDLQKFIELLLIETTTFGIRYNKFNREKLNREFKKIDTEYGTITIKIGYYKGKVVKVTPEYEECKKMAKTYKIPLNHVYNKINSTINKEFSLKLLT